MFITSSLRLLVIFKGTVFWLGNATKTGYVLPGNFGRYGKVVATRPGVGLPVISLSGKVT